MKKYLVIVERHKASTGTRFANYFIDVLMLYIIRIIIAVVFLIIYQKTGMYFFYFYHKGGFLWSSFLGALYGTLYYFLLEKYCDGRTIGKMITGTKAISTDGAKPSTKQIFLRCLYRIVPFEAFTFFGTDGWHDSMSDTRVINYKNYIFDLQAKEEINEIGER